MYKYVPPPPPPNIELWLRACSVDVSFCDVKHCNFFKQVVCAIAVSSHVKHTSGNG